MPRYAKILWWALVALPFAGTGCVGPEAGPITFQWTFGASNLSCEQAGVIAVQVSSTGITKTVPCDGDQGEQGTIHFPNAVAGDTVDFSLTGISYTFDASGNITGTTNTYQLSGNLQTDPGGGTTVASVNLTPIGTVAASDIVFLWNFAGQTCAQSGVQTVALAITDPTNGNVNTTVPCTANGTDGVRVTMYASGSYPFTLTATSGATTYYAAGTAYTNGLSDTVVTVGLEDVSQATSGQGSLTVNVVFGTSQGTCTAAGLDHVETYLTDDTGAVVSGSDVTTACSSFGGSVTYSGLSAPATYFVNVNGIANSVATYVLSQDGLSVYPDTTSTYTVDVPAMSI